MKDSRQVYRMTYLLKLPSYSKGDFLKLNESFFQIRSIHGKQIKIINLSNWKESVVDMKTMQKALILGGKEIIKDMILVSQTYNDIQVMDPKTYKISIIKKPKPFLFKSEQTKIVNFDEKNYLIPKIHN